MMEGSGRHSRRRKSEETAAQEEKAPGGGIFHTVNTPHMSSNRSPAFGTDTEEHLCGRSGVLLLLSLSLFFFQRIQYLTGIQIVAMNLLKILE
ncbi:hypothetical protein AVEN_217961-1 [Araneus ventricosus]|uniref:Uncharacterized protein n=1 Tax=Araneus ventricosus TaxID=182803 RepID=A0A4Y2DL15_ARAVE|nr:hypothetical protein AVEN_217961-1 [Araneus ventricosus]